MNDLINIPKQNGVTPLLSKCLDSQELAEHRALVGVELEVLAKKFDRFGWERDRGSLAQDRLVSDWMKALQDYPLQEVQAACAQAVLSNPSKMPNEGHVRAAILAARAKVVAAQPKPVEPSAPRATPEERARANEIVRKAGIALRNAPEGAA